MKNQFDENLLAKAIEQHLATVSDGPLPNDFSSLEIRNSHNFTYSFLEYEAEVSGDVYGMIEVDASRIDWNFSLNDLSIDPRIKHRTQRVTINEPMEHVSDTKSWCRKESGKSLSSYKTELAFRAAYENNHLAAIDKEQTKNKFNGKIRGFVRDLEQKSKDKTSSRINRAYSPVSRRIRYSYSTDASYRAFEISGHFIRCQIQRKNISGFLFINDGNYAFYSIKHAAQLPKTALEKTLEPRIGCGCVVVLIVAVLVSLFVFAAIGENSNSNSDQGFSSIQTIEDRGPNSADIPQETSPAPAPPADGERTMCPSSGHLAQMAS